MFDKPFKLEIITPSRVAFADDALSVSAPGVEGGFQVLRDHAGLLSSLEPGHMKVLKADGSEVLYATSGGVLEVFDNAVVVLAESAERAEEIDVDRARAAKDRAERRLRERLPEVDVERASMALRRALNRLRVAGTI
jgi:F-type H+-transporting ATPase subunit epsilon